MRSVVPGWQYVRSRLERFEASGRSAAEREQLRQHLFSCILLECAGVAYALAYYGYGLYGLGRDDHRVHDPGRLCPLCRQAAALRAVRAT